jgi:putative ABC transport system permease protein
MQDLIKLMSREYLVVLLISGAVGVPVSVYGVQQWLSGFAYHVELTPLSYIFTLALIFLLLFVTITLQTLRTSRINPADTLKND